MENLARYITRGASACAARPRLPVPPAFRIEAGVFQERMTYVPEDGQVLYQSKNGKQTKTFDEKF